jgi:hypothetical protein
MNWLYSVDVLDIKQEGLNLEKESEFQRKIRKISRIAISIFLMLLMLSFLIPGDIIGSLIESKRINNYEIDLGAIKIIFEKDVYENLKDFYFNHQLAEESICLTGEVKNNNYIITSFHLPRTVFKTPISISSERCSQNTIVTLHTHPFKNCLLSIQDILSYNAYRKTNPKAITGVMCDTDRFAFYFQ